MLDLEAQREMLSVVTKWPAGALPTLEFRDAYWDVRRRLLDSNWSAFYGPFGEEMSHVDVATDAYSPDPDRGWHQIDEDQLRKEVLTAVGSLRRRMPELFEDAEG